MQKKWMWKYSYILGLSFIFPLVLFSGCGRHTPKKGVVVSADTPSEAPIPKSDLPPITDPIFPDDGDLPTIRYPFEMTGRQGTHGEVVTPEELETDNLLRIRVTSSPAFRFSDGLNPEYSCLQFRVTVLYVEKDPGDDESKNKYIEGQSFTTRPLSVEAVEDHWKLCRDSHGRRYPTSQALDLSSSTGSKLPIVLKLSDAKSDSKCRHWHELAEDFGSPFANQWLGNEGSVCPMNPVFETHQVSGTLTIQVNGTEAP